MRVRLMGVSAVLNGCLLAGAHGLGLVVFLQWSEGGAFQFVGLCVNVLLAAMLVLGGVLLFRRQPSARPVLRTWAWITLTILFVEASGLASMLYDLSEKFRGEHSSAFLVILLMFSAVFIYAMLVLVWMSRRFVDRELTRWKS